MIDIIENDVRACLTLGSNLIKDETMPSAAAIEVQNGIVERNNGFRPDAGRAQGGP